jgi:hypothetical protein
VVTQSFHYLVTPSKLKQVLEFSDRFLKRPAPGLGPPRSAQREAGVCTPGVSHRRLLATVPPRALTQWGGMADSRLDGRGTSRRTSPPCGFLRTRLSSSSDHLGDPVGPTRSLVPGPFFLGSDAVRLRRPRTRRLGRASALPLPAGSGVLGPASRLSGDSLPAVRDATCGDINPDRLVGTLACQ